MARGTTRPVILVGIDAARRNRDACRVTATGVVWNIWSTPITAMPPATIRSAVTCAFLPKSSCRMSRHIFPPPTSGRHRIVGGTSNGADWAIAAAALHPDLFGNVLALSPATDGLGALRLPAEKHPGICRSRNAGAENSRHHHQNSRQCQGQPVPKPTPFSWWPGTASWNGTLCSPGPNLVLSRQKECA